MTYSLRPHRIREMREAAGMTQEQLAVLVGLSRTQVTNIEVGRCSTSFERASQIAIALGCPLDELAGIEQPDSRQAT